MVDLQTLVRRRLRHFKTKHDVTARAAIQHAADLGRPVVDEYRLSQISGYATGKRWGPPRHDTLRGVAAVLELHDEEVQDAALRSAGHEVPIRVYVRSRQAAESALCDCDPTHSTGCEELVVELPPVELTGDDLVKLIREIDRTITRQMKRVTRSE